MVRKAESIDRERFNSLLPAVKALEESARRIGASLGKGEAGWDPFPGRVAGEKEKEVIASALPILDTAARSGELREEASYLLVSLGLMTNDPAARSKAGGFLREFPSSPYAGRIAVRRGHEAVLAGRLSDRGGLYRKGAE